MRANTSLKMCLQIASTPSFETNIYMDFPEIKIGQYTVVQAELATGIILNLDGKRHLGTGKWHLIFDSLKEAKTYSYQKTAEFPEIECGIYNHLNECILRIDNLKNDSLRDTEFHG